MNKPKVIALDLGRDFHKESLARIKILDDERKQEKLPRILHCYNKYIQGWIEDELGNKRFCLAPHKGTPEYEALVNCWWNANAIGNNENCV